MYWLDPLHYAVEGLVVTQFHKDSTPITIVETGEVTTAGAFVADFYPDWQYGHRGLVAMALLLFILGFRYEYVTVLLLHYTYRISRYTSIYYFANCILSSSLLLLL